MDSLLVAPLSKPEFQIGQTVWLLEGRKVVSATIRTIKFELVGTPSYQQPMLHCVGYTLPFFNPYASDGEIYPPADLYGDKATALQMAVWHPVTGISEKGWILAIGDNEDDGTIEDSELQPCCSNIAEVRRILGLCKEAGGLVERDVQKVIALLGIHDHIQALDKSEVSRAPLQSIFSQLGIFANRDAVL